jgi:hypothetical protein
MVTVRIKNCLLETLKRTMQILQLQKIYNSCHFDKRCHFSLQIEVWQLRSKSSLSIGIKNIFSVVDPTYTMSGICCEIEWP